MKLTKTDFNTFTKLVRDWQSFWGLTEWDIDLFFLPCEDPILGGDALACTITNLEAMQATISLAMDWQDEDVNDSKLKRVALHEILEVLMSEVEELGDARYVRKGELRSATHKVINRIERAICQKKQ